MLVPPLPAAAKLLSVVDAGIIRASQYPTVSGFRYARRMDPNQFDYPLPGSLIAQFPARPRSASRLMVVRQDQGNFVHTRFHRIIDFLNPGDLLIVNDTRVVPARIRGRKPTGGAVEIMLEKIISEDTALVLVRAGKPIKTGQIILVEGQELEVIGRQEPFYLIALPGELTVAALFENYGSTPLPPYIKREVEEVDRERYQTVYSRHPGAVAAPTAGLHFDQALIDRITDKGIEWASITLHVGAGTSQPVRVNDVRDHKMHKEKIEVSEGVCESVMRVRSRGGQVIAVGTTVARALESAGKSGALLPVSADTGLFILPGYQFNVVDALITNFHLPRSTLLMMVSAFCGCERIMAAYREAIDNGYRFFSYGDAMFIERAR